MSERDQGGYAIRRTHKEKATHSHRGKLKPGAIDNDLWGPAAWLYLHTVTRVYPKEPTDEDKANYGAFFRAVAPTLPCPKCRANYTEHLATTPPALGSRAELVKWLVGVHNRTRVAQGKMPLSEREALRAIARPRRVKKRACVVM